MTMNYQSTNTGTLEMATKAAPPIAVSGASLAGIPVAEWVQWLTLVYVAVMLSHKLWSWYGEWKGTRKTKRGKTK